MRNRSGDEIVCKIQVLSLLFSTKSSRDKKVYANVEASSSQRPQIGRYQKIKFLL